MTDDRFVYQQPSAEQVESITQVRKLCMGMQNALIDITMDGRCRALALTKLEEFSKWANKGIVFPDGYGLPEKGVNS